MSFVSGLLGGSTGAGFQANTNTAAVQGASNLVNTGINQQQNFVNALGAQNGLANQASVFGQQQGLANQLQGVANGTGPNPAMAALNQATGQNVANQASLMAGQRGSGANAGLMARQAAQQGAATQQQAAGQGATMQAQQSLAAMGQLQNQQANMGQMANTQVGQQQTGLQNLNQASLQNQSNVMGLQQGANSSNAQIAAGNAQGQGNLLGSLAGAAGTALMLMADGGEAGAMPSQYLTPGMQATTSNPMAQNATQQANPSGPRSTIGQSMQPQSSSNMNGLGAGGTSLGKGLMNLGASAMTGLANMSDPEGGDAVRIPDEASNMDSAAAYAKGGKVKALVSPGEIRIHKKDVKKVADGKKSPLDGEKIPGKPKVSGAVNSYANDTVPKTLNEGDIILPRSVTESKHPHWAAKQFVEQIMAKKHRKK